MAIALKNLLLLAEENNSITVNHPDGTTSTLPFEQRSLGYGEGAGKFQFDTQPPFIIKDLPKVEETTNGRLELVGEITDNFVRGGAVTLATRAVEDVVRLGKLLLSPNGLAWAGAQVALAATNPKGPILPIKPGSRKEEGQGFISNVRDTIQENLPPRNRLKTPVNLLLTTGTGAAGIRFRKDGLLDTEFENGFNYNPNLGGPKYESTLLAYSTTDSENETDFSLFGKYTNVYGGGFEDKGVKREDLILRYPAGPHSTFGIGDTEIKRYKADPYRGYLPLFNQDLFVLRQGDLTTNPNIGEANYVDYRTIQGKGPIIESSKTRINLYNLGDPGIDLQNNEGNYDVYNIKTIDRISAANIFKRENLESFDNTFKDYIKFKIAVVDNENPLNDNIILFRALLDNIADNYSGNWNSFKYNGRAEEFYTYDGFKRNISFGFKVHTQTRHEQKPLWRKLNYLVAQTAPEYKNRRMRGVFSRLTIGDWMNEIPGFFTSVNLSWNTAYPWEIRHDADGVDRDLNEYPHILDVSCEFQPVHNFAPSNSPTTPFILPEIGVNNNRKYARQSDNENQDEFDINGIAADAQVADIDIISVPEPPAPPPALNPLPTPSINNPSLSNDITPIEERGLAL